MVEFYHHNCFVIVLHLFLYINWNYVSARPNIFMGRTKYGTIGEPNRNTTKQKLLIEMKTIHPKHILQKLDNFSPLLTPKWQNRYYSNDKYYKKNGPIFLMLRGENPASRGFMVAGAWINYAQNVGAMLFQLEQRFYGKSIPTRDLKLESLQYLTVKQTLADVANFIRKMNRKHNYEPEKKWIVFGGSFAGALAVWLRVTYPDLVFGVISSSGPINPTLDFKEYLSSVTKTYLNKDQKCPDAIGDAMKDVHIMARNPKGRSELYQQLVLCTSLTNATEWDLANLMYTISGDFAYPIQFTKDNTNKDSLKYETVCNVMTDETIGKPFERLVMLNKMFLKEQREPCVNFQYSSMIQELKQTSINSPAAQYGDRQWLYQTCSELGFFQSSNSNYQVFGHDFDLPFFNKQCQDSFGPNFNTINDNNEIVNYGGLRPNTTNVLCVEGSIDPWRKVGLTQNLTSGVQALLINGTGHVADIYAPSHSDPLSLKQARQIIVKYIAKLLSQKVDIVSMNSPQYSSSFNKDFLATSGPKHGFKFSNLKLSPPVKSFLQPFKSSSSTISQQSKSLMQKNNIQPFKSSISIGFSQKLKFSIPKPSVLLREQMTAAMNNPLSTNSIESSFAARKPVMPPTKVVSVRKDYSVRRMNEMPWTGRLMYQTYPSRRY